LGTVPKNRQKIMHIEGLLLEKRLQNARARRGFGGFCRQKRLQKWNARTCTRCLIFHGSFQCIQAPGVGARIPFCKSKSRRPTRRRALCNSCRERNSQGTLRDMAGISAYLGTGVGNRIGSPQNQRNLFFLSFFHHFFCFWKFPTRNGNEFPNFANSTLGSRPCVFFCI